jgi:hypothetical protein
MRPAIHCRASRSSPAAIGLVLAFIGGCASAGLRRGVPLDRGFAPVDVPICVTRVKHAGGVERSVHELKLRESFDLPSGPIEIDVRLCSREMPSGPTFTLAFEAQRGDDYEVAATISTSTMSGPEGGGDDLAEVVVRDAASSKILDEASVVPREE